MRLTKFLAALAFGLALAFNAAAGDFFKTVRWDNDSAPKFDAKQSSFVFTMHTGKLPKGAVVDFATAIGLKTDGGPERWVCEVYDGKRWRCDDGPVSFTVKWYKSENPTTYMHTFILEKTVKREVKVRLRTLDKTADPAKVYFKAVPWWVPLYMAVSTKPVKDRRSMLLLGNSFTYFGGTYIALHEIARTQGRTLDMTLNIKGGMSFAQHLKLEKTLEAISSRAPYDIALLQNNSFSASLYASDRIANADIMAAAVAMAAKVREFSPNTRMVLERTWSYADKNYRGFGSYEAFDAALQEGAEDLASAMHAELSPIGPAFILGREQRLPLYVKDNFHQSVTGAYLKACVNYLFLFREPFTDGVSDYGLDPATAAACRAIATKVVNLE